MHPSVSSILQLELPEVELVLISLYTAKVVKCRVSQPRGRAPPKGHRINLRGHEMITGVEKNKSKVPLHKSVLIFWTLPKNENSVCLC